MIVMNKYLEVLLAALCFGVCVYLALFARPQWHRDAACLATGALCLWFAIPSWTAYPELRPLLVVALALAFIPSVVAVLNTPFIPF